MAIIISAVKEAMECLHWLVKSEILHTTHYNSLLTAVEFVGCEALNHLNHGNNTKYHRSFKNLQDKNYYCHTLPK